MKDAGRAEIGNQYASKAGERARRSRGRRCRAPSAAAGRNEFGGRRRSTLSVSIYPPSATSMTVCYGFVCRRRHIHEFTPADRTALTQIMSGGRANAAVERAALQKAVIWFDRRMGPILGTSRRVAKADFRHRDERHNYDCWDTTRNTTSLLLVLQEWEQLKFHDMGEPRIIAATRWCCRRRTTPPCWSIAPPGLNGCWICGRAAICSRPTS